MSDVVERLLGVEKVARAVIEQARQDAAHTAEEARRQAQAVLDESREKARAESEEILRQGIREAEEARKRTLQEARTHTSGIESIPDENVRRAASRVVEVIACGGQPQADG